MKDIKELLNFGLINIDKPAGPTSYSVSEFVRRQLGLKKTSHMGTLDPKVTGVLPITLGRTCKLAGYFIRHDKTYVGILETHKDCSIEVLQKLIDENFSGKIKQTPPHKSAVKREEREREVYLWKLTEAGDDKRSFLFEVRVEGGTYIRKLCSDLGDMIGGAHMGELRRTEAGIFSELGVGGLELDEGKTTTELGGKLVNLFDFKSAVDKWKLDGDTLAHLRKDKAGVDPDSKLRAMVVPAEEAIRKVLPCVEVDKSALKSLYTGKKLYSSNVIVQGNGKLVIGNRETELKDGDVFAVFCEGIFVGIYKRGNEEIIFGRSEFVFN